MNYNLIDYLISLKNYYMKIYKKTTFLTNEVNVNIKIQKGIETLVNNIALPFERINSILKPTGLNDNL